MNTSSLQKPHSFLLLFRFTFTGSARGSWKSYCTMTSSWILSRVVDWSTRFVCAFSFWWILFQMISGLGRFWFLFNTWRLWWFLKFRYWTSWFTTSARACSSTARVWASGCCSLARWRGQWNSRRFLIHWFNRGGLFEFFRFWVMHERYPSSNLSNFRGRRTNQNTEEFYQGKMNWY